MIPFLFFTILGSVHAAPVVIEKIKASINNQLVLKSDLKKFRETVSLRQQLDPIFASTTLSKEGSSASDEKITDFLIQEQLILQAFPLSDTEVEQEINSIQTGNHISREQLKTALTAQGFLFSDYFELIRSGVSKRNLLDREIRTKVSLTDEDVKNYYKTHFANEQKGFIEKSYKILMFSNKSEKVTLDALKKIKAGESFEELTKKLSDGPSHETGGDLGFLSSKQMSAPLKKIILKLKVGELSPLVKINAQSFMFVKLSEIATDDVAHFKSVEPQVKAELSNTEFQKQLAIWTDKQKQSVFIHQSP